MNGSILANSKLLTGMLKFSNTVNTELVICPPFPYLQQVKEYIVGSKIKLGAQNISHLPEGPVTGEISAAMIKNSGADFVILGHSERRELHTETEEVIKSKILEASNHNIYHVLCIGEPKEIYAAKKTEDFLYSQLQGSLNNLNKINLSIAYEPIWAIGTGDVAKPSDINKIHSIIKEICSREFDVKLENIIYGGSVNDQNSKEIFEQEHVNGALIGGASLDGHSFGRIANNFFEIHNG